MKNGCLRRECKLNLKSPLCLDDSLLLTTLSKLTPFLAAAFLSLSLTETDALSPREKFLPPSAEEAVLFALSTNILRDDRARAPSQLMKSQTRSTTLSIGERGRKGKGIGRREGVQTGDEAGVKERERSRRLSGHTLDGWLAGSTFTAQVSGSW
jgi:hypothetical protein